MSIFEALLALQVVFVVLFAVAIFTIESLVSRILCDTTLTIDPGAIACYGKFKLPWKPITVRVGTSYCKQDITPAPDCAPNSAANEDSEGNNQDREYVEFFSELSSEFSEFLRQRQAQST